MKLGKQNRPESVFDGGNERFTISRERLQGSPGNKASQVDSGFSTPHFQDEEFWYD